MYASRNGSDSFVLEVDEDPDLKISHWTDRRENTYEGLAVFKGEKSTSGVEARLYPAGNGSRWCVGLETLTAIFLFASLTPEGSGRMGQFIDITATRRIYLAAILHHSSRPGKPAKRVHEKTRLQIARNGML